MARRDHPIRVLWKRGPEDPGLSVDILIDKPGLDVDAYVEEFKLRRPTWTYVGQVHRDNLPSRRFRNAWKVNGATFEVHLPGARQIRMAELRTERNARLDAGDGREKALNATGTAAQKRAYAGYMQELRDLPAVVDPLLEDENSAADLEKFQVDWPAEP